MGFTGIKKFKKTRIFKKGFTLLELMVVVAILVITITGLLASFISSYFLNQATSNKAIAVNDAQYALEKLKNENYDNITDYTDNLNFTNLDSESINVTVYEVGNVKTVNANVTWTERQQQRSFDITTLFAQR